MEEQRIQFLTDKYINNSCSAEELKELLALVGSPDEEMLMGLLNAQLLKEEVSVSYGDHAPVLDAAYANIEQQLGFSQPAKRVFRLWPIAAAASILLITGISLFVLSHKEKPAVQITAKNDIRPGGNKAVLTLADGKRISLTDAKAGTLASVPGVHITKTKDGELIYQTVSENPATSPSPLEGAGAGVAVTFNSVETPKGGQYQVVLPDGTRVWLNAVSQLKYPARFSGRERMVELTGEAYFEVVHNAKMPFRVKTAGQVVEDIGTGFNVNAYADEPVTRTTLIEGSVKVNGTVLQPGQQANLSAGGALAVREVDTDDAVAWKNGEFSFRREELHSVMRKVARWYDLKVIYEGNLDSPVAFTGSVSRFENVSKVLSKLEKTADVNFELKGATLVVHIK